MKRLLVLCLAVAACSQPASPPAQRGAPLMKGMSEQQVVEAQDDRMPDRVVRRICGNETPAPFPCQIYVYESTWRDGRFHPKLSVVFEEVRGKWLGSQWL